MKIGVSTACLYPSETEIALKALAERGIASVEVFFNSPSELEPPFLEKLRGIAREYGQKVTAVHPYSCALEPFFFFTGYKRRFEDALKVYEAYYRAAVYLDAEIVVLHGDCREGLLSDDEYFNRYGEMFLHAKRSGVILAQENVERCKSRSAAFIKNMRETLGGDVRFVLDMKQAIRSGETPFTMLEAMGSAVCHLHLSDSTADKDCLPPGSGGFDFKELFNRVKALNNGADGVVELYRSNYKTIDDLYISYSFLDAIL